MVAGYAGYGRIYMGWYFIFYLKRFFKKEIILGEFASAGGETKHDPRRMQLQE